MKNRTAIKGFIGIELAIVIAVLVIAAIGGAYVVHQKIETSAALSATTTPSTTATSTDGSTTPTEPIPPQGGTVITATTTSTVTITSADTGRTIYMHPGDRFVLDLDNGLKWSNIVVADTSIVEPAETFAQEKDGVFQALAAGTTTLTASGAPICIVGQACPQFMLLFRVVIVVD